MKLTTEQKEKIITEVKRVLELDIVEFNIGYFAETGNLFLTAKSENSIINIPKNVKSEADNVI